MTPAELLRACDEQTKIGLPFLVLTIPRRKHGFRVRVMPGVTGHVIGSDRERLHVSVQVRAVVACLERLAAQGIVQTESVDDAKVTRGAT